MYTIHSGDVDGVFNIDAETGKIFVADLDRLKNPYMYLVVLRVYDLGYPPLFAETKLQIEVNFPNTTDFGALPSNGENDEESGDSYVIIVGVIGGATLVLSGIIIGAIFFVLRSERQRKSRDSSSVLKNDYVPAPTKFCVPSDTRDTKIPSSPERGSSQSDLSTSGVILSPKGLPQKPEAQKKVSFSFDEPDAEERQIQSREILSAQAPHASHHEGSGDAWKRLVSVSKYFFSDLFLFFFSYYSSFFFFLSFFLSFFLLLVSHHHHHHHHHLLLLALLFCCCCSSSFPPAAAAVATAPVAHVIRCNGGEFFNTNVNVTNAEYIYTF